MLHGGANVLPCFFTDHVVLPQNALYNRGISRSYSDNQAMPRSALNNQVSDIVPLNRANVIKLLPTLNLFLA